MTFETVQEKVVDELLDSRGYSDAKLTPLPRGSVRVEAEKTALLHNGRWRLDARVTRSGRVLNLKERDW